jgi:hypothetical protein
MLLREVVAVCSEIHTKHVNAISGHSVEVLVALGKLRKETISFVMDVRPHGRTGLPLDGFS